ncbi:anti-sigma regulatory factor [bacterium]|nr:anti-sigma regulatory factor [bacterium]
MTDQPLFKKAFPVKGDFASAGEASVKVKNILKDIGYDSGVIRRVAVATYEAEMNVVMYGGGGEIVMAVNADHVNIIIVDQGPGIPDIKQALVEGYSTATEEMREMGFGAGMGLPNIRKNSNEFTIDSEMGKGTRLDLVFRCGG